MKCRIAVNCPTTANVFQRLICRECYVTTFSLVQSRVNAQSRGAPEFFDEEQASKIVAMSRKKDINSLLLIADICIVYMR